MFAFIYGWKLTLVVLSCAPLVMVSSAFVAKVYVPKGAIKFNFFKHHNLDAKFIDGKGNDSIRKCWCHC